ncbi:MAG: hypothetical protein Q7S09_05445 [bacterium]|nr:hypothetical protein [bacterium]
MMSFLKKHAVILPVAFSVALFMLLPQILYTRTLGGDYRGIPRFVNDDAWYYLTRARDVIDGYPSLGNPYFAEHKTKPSVLVSLLDVLEAKPLGWLGIEVPDGFLFWISFFNFLNAVLIYAAVFLLTRSRLAGILAAAFLFLGMFVHSFNRPTSNSATTPFWIAEFMLLLLFLRARHRSWPVFTANVLGLGILFYIYPYFWSFYLALFLVLSALWYFLHKLFSRRTEWSLIARLRSWFGSAGDEDPPSSYSPKYLLGVMGCALIVAIPYFLNLREASQLPEFGETFRRDGGLVSHFPAGILIVLPAGALLGVSWLLLRLRIITYTKEVLLIASGLIAVIGVTNQHILTGKHIEPSLHYFDIGMMWSTFAASYLASCIARRLRSGAQKFFIILCIGIVMAFVGYSLLGHARSYGVIYESERNIQRYRPALDWLASAIGRDDVVLANETLSALIPMYTAANVLFDRNANHFFVSDKEVRERFLLNHYFDAVDENFLRARERSLWGVQYIDAGGHARQQNKLRKLLRLPLKSVPVLPVDEIEGALSSFRELQERSFEAELRRYNVRWIVWDVMHDPHWAEANSLSFLDMVQEVDGVAIFRLH